MRFTLMHGSRNWEMHWSYNDCSYVTEFDFTAGSPPLPKTSMWVDGEKLQLETKDERAARHQTCIEHGDEPNDDKHVVWFDQIRKYEVEALQRLQAIMYVVDLH